MEGGRANGSAAESDMTMGFGDILPRARKKTENEMGFVGNRQRIPVKERAF